MTVEVSLGLLTGVLAFGAIAFIFLTAQARAVWSEIAAGGSNGRPLGPTVREVMIWQMWVPYALFCVVLGLAFAGIAFLVARYTEAGDVRLLGYFIGYSFLIAGAVWLTFGPFGTVMLRRAVRDTRPDDEP